MNSSDPSGGTAPRPDAGGPPAERRFARRIDCAPRLPSAPPPAGAAPPAPPPPPPRP